MYLHMHSDLIKYLYKYFLFDLFNLRIFICFILIYKYLNKQIVFRTLLYEHICTYMQSEIIIFSVSKQLCLIWIIIHVPLIIKRNLIGINVCGK